MQVEEVEALWASGYRPWDIYNQNESLRNAIDLIASGYFSDGDPDLFRPLVDSLLYHDPYMVLADYQAYADCQQRVGAMYLDQEQWSRMAILNVSRMGLFSSDRSITDYCEKVWRVQPAPVALKWERLPKEGIVFPQPKPSVRR